MLLLALGALTAAPATIAAPFRNDDAGIACLGCRTRAVGGGLLIELGGSRLRSAPRGPFEGASGTGLAPLEHPLYPAMEQAARLGEVDAGMVKAVAWTESRFRRESVSPKGAQGLMQLMPETATRLGVVDAFDTTQSLAGGARLLGQLLRRYQGDVTLALAAYNAGEGAVARFGMQVPPFAETRHYIAHVKASMARLAGATRRPDPAGADVADAGAGKASLSNAGGAVVVGAATGIAADVTPLKPRRVDPPVMVPASLSGAIVRVAAPATSPAHEAADAYMAARDRGDYPAMAEMLSRSGQEGWTAERAQRIDAGRQRVSGAVVSRRYVAEKPGAGGSTTVVYETQFAKSGRSEERVLVLRSGERQAVAGHTARHCSTGACFKDE
ncbi:MAG: hypothetical protein EOO24_02135 [Comamonadaceae bacterium]|nr:MAG: hypothetical protein EOO24_02135 [Comamonadaceae bacterium]